MKGKFLLLIVSILVLLVGGIVPNVSFAVGEEWVARYNGPLNDSDIAHSIAIDASGNIYVSGFSYSNLLAPDYVTIKYDSFGNQLWVARYGPHSGDWVNDMVVDSLENVYVVGSVDGDNVTIKYDTNGNELWVARYNGLANKYDAAHAVALDSLGNIYVTGESATSASEYVTIKYDSLGNQLWVARYNGPGSSWDYPNAISVDSSDNVYVTGRSIGSNIQSDYDYATIKYDTNGNELWAARYKGSGAGGYFFDEANDMTVDSLGNVYVTGTSVSATGYDCTTIKYDSNGNKIWERRYNSGWYNCGNAIASDSFGNVYLTGKTSVSQTEEYYITIKYDSLGNLLWVRKYYGPANHGNQAFAIILDPSNNVYVTGLSLGSGGTSHDYATIIYDTNGNKIWEARYDGQIGNVDTASDIALDSSGNVYVTGSSVGLNSGFDYATVKYLSHPGQNYPPVLSKNIPDQSWAVSTSNDNAFDLDDYFTDADGDELSYTVEGNVNIIVAIDANNMINFSQPANWLGSETVIFTANDGWGGITRSNSVTLTVLTEQQAITQETQILADVISTLPDISQGEENSLITKLYNVLAKVNLAVQNYNNGDITLALTQLNTAQNNVEAFINEIEAKMSAGKIDQTTGNDLIIKAQDIISLINSLRQEWS